MSDVKSARADPLHLDNRKDLLLLILGAPGTEDAEPVIGVTRLQKYLFLLQQQHQWHEKHNIVDPYDFEAYNFGPFDVQLYDDIQLLENAGLIVRSPAGPEPSAENEESRRWAYESGAVDQELAPWEEENRIQSFALTERGRDFVKRYDLEASDIDVLTRLKQEWNQKPLQEFLRWLYKEYPDWAANTQLKHLRP